MAHDDDEMGAVVEGDWCASGEHVTRGGKHFGRWWVAERAEVTEDGVAVEHVFYGYQPNERGDLTVVHGLEAAREFAAQMLAAIEHAASSD